MLDLELFDNVLLIDNTSKEIFLTVFQIHLSFANFLCCDSLKVIPFGILSCTYQAALYFDWISQLQCRAAWLKGRSNDRTLSISIQVYN